MGVWGRKFLIHVGGASLHFGIIMGNGFDVASAAAGQRTIGERVLQKVAVCYCILVPQVVIRPPAGKRSSITPLLLQEVQAPCVVPIHPRDMRLTHCGWCSNPRHPRSTTS